MLPDLPRSKSLINAFITEIVKESLRQHCGPYFSEIPEKPIHEGDAFATKYSESFTQESNLQEIVGSSDFNKDEILSNKTIIIKKLVEIGQQMGDQQMKMLFETISDVTEKVGNVVESKKDITPDDIFNIYNKITIDFNPDGTARLPTIITGTEMFPKMQKVLETIFADANYKKKFEEIIEAQKKRWYDRENNRKLVG